jgi:hypothetical protein
VSGGRHPSRQLGRDPRVRNRCAQRIAVLTLTPNRPAARADLPDVTDAATRSRKSLIWCRDIVPQRYVGVTTIADPRLL